MRMRDFSWFICIVVILTIGALIWPVGRRGFVYTRSAIYALARERGRANYVASLANWHKLSSEHFIIKYQDADGAVAPIVLAIAEENRRFVDQRLAYTPTGKSVIAIYPNREDLRASFGWPASQSAVGVYWAGAIRLLSPRVWAGNAADTAALTKAFRESGPFVHEYTHLVLDYRTGGNYPRWFSEGIAQWYEYQASGYIWNDPAGELTDRNAAELYSLGDLTRHFEVLDNEALSYRQSLSLVTYLAGDDDGQRLTRLIDRLAAHYPFERALAAEYGLTLADFEAGWQEWVATHPYPW